jgi:nitrogen fixation protein NifU and related proteins
MSELQELYEQVILDHNRKPRNFRKVPAATQHAEGVNPLCGDAVRVELRVEDGVIRDIGFQGSGCAISRASASLMTSHLLGKPVADAEEVFGRFHAMVTGAPAGAGAADALGKLTVFAGVREFPSRVKCATLPWHTVHAALAGQTEPVTTE